MDLISTIVLVVVVLVVLAILATAFAITRRGRLGRRVAKADSIRRQATKDAAVVQQREAEAAETAAAAKRAQADAAAKSAEADRLREKAREAQEYAASSREKVNKQFEHAAKIDPRVGNGEPPRTGRQQDLQPQSGSGPQAAMQDYQGQPYPQQPQDGRHFRGRQAQEFIEPGNGRHEIHRPDGQYADPRVQPPQRS